MNKIDRHNYEAFYLDYIEGNLNAEETAELLLFLENHADLKNEFEGFEMITLNANEKISIDFSDLKKEITPLNAEDFIIGSIENQLTEDDEKELATVIFKNNSLQKLATLYSKTILPKSIIKFPEKAKLKRKAGILIFMTPLRRVAAIGLLLIALVPFLNREAKVELADNKKPIDDVTNDSSLTFKKNSIPSETVFEKSSNPVKSITKLIANKVRPTSSTITKNEIAIANPESAKEKKSKPSLQLELLEPKRLKKVLVTKSEDALAVNKVEISTPSEPIELLAKAETEPQTIGEFLNQNIRKKLFKNDEAKDNKIQGNELLASATTLLQQKTNANIAFTHRESASSTSYSFTLGKLSFSKTKNN